MEEDGKRGKSCYDELSKRDKMAPEVEPKGKKAMEEEPGASGVILSFVCLNQF